WIAVQIVRVKNGSNVAQAMAGDCGYLHFVRFDQRQPRYPSAAQIVECHTGNTGGCLRLTPRWAEPVRGPRLAVAIGKDDWRSLRRGVERGFKRRPDLDIHRCAGLRLPQPNAVAVIGRPGKPQQIALPLSGPQCERKRQTEMGRSRTLECSFLVGCPDFIDAVPPINPPPLARMDCC